MKNIKQLKIYFLLIIFLANILYISPIYALNSREDAFKRALDLSSIGKFDVALQEWNIYLESYPDDAAAYSNRGNVKLVIGDIEGSIADYKTIKFFNNKTIVDGFTTNPSLMRLAGAKNYRDYSLKILKICKKKTNFF